MHLIISKEYNSTFYTRSIQWRLSSSDPVFSGKILTKVPKQQGNKPTKPFTVWTDILIHNWPKEGQLCFGAIVHKRQSKPPKNYGDMAQEVCFPFFSIMINNLIRLLKNNTNVPHSQQELLQIELKIISLMSDTNWSNYKSLNKWQPWMHVLYQKNYQNKGYILDGDLYVPTSPLVLKHNRWPKSVALRQLRKSCLPW